MINIAIIKFFIASIFSKFLIYKVSKYADAYDDENWNDVIETRSDDPENEYNEYSSFSRMPEPSKIDKFIPHYESMSEKFGN